MKIEGIYLRKDLKEYITESFVERYSINLDNWIAPFAYWSQFTESTLSNGHVLDGTYVLFGSVSYPGVEKLSYHRIFQYNIVRIMGADVTFAADFNAYIGLPDCVPLRPVFPLFKVDQPRAFNKARNIYFRRMNRPLTHSELKYMIEKVNNNSLEDKLFRIRLALQTEVDREK